MWGGAASYNNDYGTEPETKSNPFGNKRKSSRVAPAPPPKINLLAAGTFVDDDAFDNVIPNAPESKAGGGVASGYNNGTEEWTVSDFETKTFTVS